MITTSQYTFKPVKQLYGERASVSGIISKWTPGKGWQREEFKGNEFECANHLEKLESQGVENVTLEIRKAKPGFPGTPSYIYPDYSLKELVKL